MPQTTVAEQTYRSILADVRAQIGPERFEVWFEDVSLVSLFRGVITIGVANRFALEFIRETFQTSFEDASERVLGTRLRCDFEIDDKLQREQQRGMERDSLNDTLELAGKALEQSRGLDDFIEVPESRYAYRAVKHVLEGEGLPLNPLFLHGPPGSGKSHLLAAFDRYTGGLDPEKPRIFRINALKFTSAYSMSLKRRKLDRFLGSFRERDIVIFDEVHRFRNKKQTQGIFVQVLKDLLKDRIQVVMASRHRAKDIFDCSPSFRSHLGNGISVGIEAYSSDSLRKIIGKLCQGARADAKKIRGWDQGLLPDVPKDVIEVIAGRSRGNVSQALAQLVDLYRVADSNKRSVDAAYAEECLRQTLGATALDRTVEGIVAAVAHHFDVKVEDLLSRRKVQRMSLPRAVVATVLSRRLQLPLKRIGLYLNRAHSTIGDMIRNHADTIAADAELGRLMAALPIHSDDETR